MFLTYFQWYPVGSAHYFIILRTHVVRNWLNQLVSILCSNKINSPGPSRKKGGANIYFPKYWYRKKFRERKLLDIIKRCKINISRFSMFLKLAGFNFIFWNIIPTRNFPETKLMDAIGKAKSIIFVPLCSRNGRGLQKLKGHTIQKSKKFYFKVLRL